VHRTRFAVALGVVLTALSSPAATSSAPDALTRLHLPALGEKHERLDSTLARAAEQAPPNEEVQVEAVARGGRRAELEAAIRAAGGSTSGRYANLVEARVPTSALETLAADPALRRLRTPTRPYPQAVSGEGIGATGASTWHSAGTTGAGVEIAIVDIGFAGWQGRLGNELPAEVATADFCPAGLFDGPGADDHGTAVAEIVHELAPSAKLHLVCIDDLVSLGRAKDYVATNDIPIVNHSVAWLNTSRGDGNGVAGSPDAIVADARAQGVLWVNAAGNYGEEHWSGSFFDADTDGTNLHDFAPGDEANDVFLFEEGCVFLKWDDWPASDQDFDLYLFRESDDLLVDSSENPQDGSQEPAEMVCADAEDEYYVVIRSFAAGAAPRFDLFATGGSALEHSVPAGSVVEPASSPAALAAGAVCWQSGALQPQPYSSRGPTIDNRVKPDVSGQDANSTATYGNSANCDEGFSGTSASAAHVTGAAALLKQANPSFGPAQLQAAVEAKAADLLAGGKDNDSGAGKVALGSAPPTPPAVPASNAPPAIAGLAHQDQTLTASGGEWTGVGAPLIFRWLRCDGGGANCAPIAGARNSTYVAGATDLGSRLRVRVTALNTGGATQAVSAETAQIQTPLQAPVNTTPPSVAVVAQAGQAASASLGSWSSTSQLSFQIEWLRCNGAGDACVAIAGAGAATYQVNSDDIGTTLRVRVTATNPAGSSSAMSLATPVISAPVPGLLTPPSITGNAVQGQTLSAAPGTWTFAAAVSFQWRRCTADGATCSDVSGATGATYTLRQADAGFRLQVAATATNAAGSNSATSSPSAVVIGPVVGPPPHGVPPPPAGQPRLVAFSFSHAPRPPQAGRRFALTLRVGTRVTSSFRATRRVTCSAKIGKRTLRPAVRSVRGGVARCAWTIPRSAAGKRLRSAIVVFEGQRSVRRSLTARIRAGRLR
jgi:hypothetical protein